MPRTSLTGERIVIVGAGIPTETNFSAVPVTPTVLVTVKRTRKMPAVAYVCGTVAITSRAPSPNSHAYRKVSDGLSGANDPRTVEVEGRRCGGR